MTMDRDRLSLVATYSGEEYLPEQPAGYVAWTWRPDGPVVRDGGPTDGTVTALGQFVEATALAVQVLARGEDVGCARSSERAVGSRYGPPVALSDHGDVRPPPRPVRVQAELGRVAWGAAQARGWLSAPAATPASSDATGRLDPAARP